MTLNWKERIKPITGIGNKLDLANGKKEKKESGKKEEKRKKKSENQKLCLDLP